MKVTVVKNKVLITGAAGFVGQATVEEFVKQGWAVRALTRSVVTCDRARRRHVEYIAVGDISDLQDWSKHCNDCSVIVHLAARAHRTAEAPTEQREAFNRVNCEASVRLAESAVACGVKRFVYISSAGVMGDFSERPFTEIDSPAPVSEYARSKWKAEKSLSTLCDSSRMELTILRPTLIYGPGNPGNLERLLRLIKLNSASRYPSLASTASAVF